MSSRSGRCSLKVQKELLLDVVLILSVNYGIRLKIMLIATTSTARLTLDFY